MDTGQSELYGAASIRQAYCDWLSGVEWSTFGTFTFARRRNVSRAADIFRRHFVYSGRYASPSVVVWGAEPHQSGAGHVHALFKWHPWCKPAVEAFNFARLWYKMYGRAEVKPYDPELGGAYYLTKYVLKDAAGSGEWGVETPGGVTDGEATDSCAERLSLDGRSVHDGDADSRQEEKVWRTQAEVEEEIGQEEVRLKEILAAEEVYKEILEARKGREV